MAFGANGLRRVLGGLAGEVKRQKKNHSLREHYISREELATARRNAALYVDTRRRRTIYGKILHAYPSRKILSYAVQ